jgi:VWFA-related protein
MRRSTYIQALALAIGVLTSISAGEDEVVFRSDVSLVRVDAQVLDRDNRAITGLRITDFVLRDEGRTQQIKSFASENMPVDVLFLLDVSASMRPHVERIADAAHQALQVLKTDDRMGIMVFDRSSRLRLAFSKSHSQVQRELNALLDDETFRGGTDITRGLYDAAAYVRREGRRDARRAIVILTDDQTQLNKDVDGVSRALTRADAVLCALIAPDALAGRSSGRRSGGYPGGIGGGLGGIIIGGGGRRGGGPMSRGPRTQSAGTAEIARQSGGDSMSVDDASALEDTLTRLRQRYALYFSLPPGVKAGEERAIEVSLADSALRRHSDADVRYRRVYIASANSSTAPGSAAEPTIITRDTGASPDVGPAVGQAAGQAADQPPPIRRRRAIEDGPRQGPMDVSGTSSAPAPAPQPQVQAPAAAPPAPSPAPSNDQPGQGGWRAARPDEK